MNNRDIEWRRKKLEQFRESLESGQMNAVREILPDRVIEQSGSLAKARKRLPLEVWEHLHSWDAPIF